MKYIPAWPKVRWSIDEDELLPGGLIVRGDTMFGKAKLSLEQCIGNTELSLIKLPFWVLRRNAMRVIRALISEYLERRMA